MKFKYHHYMPLVLYCQVSGWVPWRSDASPSK